MAGQLRSCVPTIRISDARVSVPYYVDGLGFKKLWEHRFQPGLPVFVAIERDGHRVFLTEHPEASYGGMVYFYVEDVNDLARSFASAGVQIGDGPTDQSWGTRELWLRDPDGNSLRFGQPLD